MGDHNGKRPPYKRKRPRVSPRPLVISDRLVRQQVRHDGHDSWEEEQQCQTRNLDEHKRDHALVDVTGCDLGRGDAAQIEQGEAERWCEE